MCNLSWIGTYPLFLKQLYGTVDGLNYRLGQLLFWLVHDDCHNSMPVIELGVDS